MRDAEGVSTPTTFPELLREALRTDPSRPFVTFYDEASGERVELSLATYANWVAKASSLLADEHGLERGARIRIDLPPHWLSFVFLGAAWNVGLVVDSAACGGVGGDGVDADDVEAVVCGPETLGRWAGGDALVLACSLLPLGVRFADPLPAGVHDVGVEIWGQPDAFVPWDPPEPGDAATSWGSTQADLGRAELGTAAAGSTLTGGSRLLSETDPASPPGAASLTEPLLTGGSVVLVAHADPDRLAAIAAAERVTDRFPRGDVQD